MINEVEEGVSWVWREGMICDRTSTPTAELPRCLGIILETEG